MMGAPQGMPMQRPPMNMSMAPMQMGHPGMPPAMQGGAPNRPAHYKPPKDLPSLHVSNLGDDVYEANLYSFFKNKGYKIIRAKIVFDKLTSKPRGFGYINFQTEEEAERCLKEQQNAQIGKRQVVLQRTKSKDTNYDKEANIIVRNLPKDLTQDQLRQMFAEFGNIISCKIEVNLQGQSKGYGYIQFEKIEEAQKAIEKMNQQEVGEENKKRIDVMVH